MDKNQIKTLLQELKDAHLVKFVRNTWQPIRKNKVLKYLNDDPELLYCVLNQTIPEEHKCETCGKQVTLQKCGYPRFCSVKCVCG